MKNNKSIIIKEAPAEALIVVNSTKEYWKNDYTLKARFYMRIVSFLFPGFLKIKLKQ